MKVKPSRPFENKCFPQDLVQNAGLFLKDYVPDAVDPTELLEIAGSDCSDFDWEAVFKPDLIDDCDGFEKDYFEDTLWDGEEDLWGAQGDLSNDEEDLWYDEKDLCFSEEIESEFRRKNRLLTISLQKRMVRNH